jgi:hypothetical protein
VRVCVVLRTGLIVPVVRKPELDDDSNSDDDDAECAVEIEERKPPSVLPDIPPLSTLLSKEPSPLLAFNLLDVLYATPSIHTTRHPRVTPPLTLASSGSPTRTSCDTSTESLTAKPATRRRFLSRYRPFSRYYRSPALCSFALRLQVSLTDVCVSAALAACSRMPFTSRPTLRSTPAWPTFSRYARAHDHPR